jgi:hypothetical protein
LWLLLPFPLQREGLAGLSYRQLTPGIPLGVLPTS